MGSLRIILGASANGHCHMSKILVINELIGMLELNVIVLSLEIRMIEKHTGPCFLTQKEKVNNEKKYSTHRFGHYLSTWWDFSLSLKNDPCPLVAI